MDAPLARDNDRLLIEAIEEQRRQLGCELHDTLCQTLAATGILMETILRAAEAGRPASTDRARKLKTLLEDVIDRTRVLSQRFNPPSLEGHGLMTTLADLALQLSTITRCEFKCEKPVFVGRLETALALFRVAQENCLDALTKSEMKPIHIALTQDVERICLEIRHQGDQNSRLNELSRRRAQSVGGVLVATAGPAGEVRLNCCVPVAGG